MDNMVYVLIDRGSFWGVFKTAERAKEVFNKSMRLRNIRIEWEDGPGYGEDEKEIRSWYVKKECRVGEVKVLQVPIHQE